MARIPPEQFVRLESGVILPASAVAVSDDQPPAALANVGIYLTYHDLTGRVMPEKELVERLGKLSADDCLARIAFLSCRMAAADEPYFDSKVQRRLIADVAGEGSPLAQVLAATLDDDHKATVFCEQQLVHLARLAVLHADPRPHDDFDGLSLYDEWVTCLIGVNDLLDEDLAVEKRGERLSWELRQIGLNHHEDQLPMIAVQHEIYRELWPELNPEEAAGIEAAFVRHTGMKLADYITVGIAVQSRFMAHGQAEEGLAGVKPAEYFSAVDLRDEDWQPFFGITARDLDGLREALRDEERRYGPTTYGSLTFERHPLFEAEPGLFLPVSLPSLQRRITEGVFHLLAEAGEEEGLDRRTYTAPFGVLFQELVERSLRRGIDGSGQTVPIATDVPYEGPSGERRSSDVILGYEGHPVFVEVVSGPLQVGTLTRGDLGCFDSDVERLVLYKADQLQTSIDDFFEGRLVLDGIDPATPRRVAPVIVTSHAFPHAETIIEEVESRLRGRKLLQAERIDSLAIVSAEELCFCEGFMQQGKTFLQLVRGWKSGLKARLPFKNYLIELGGGRAPGSDHAELQYAKAVAERAKRLFGSERTAEEVLAHLRADPPDQSV